MTASHEPGPLETSPTPSPAETPIVAAPALETPALEAPGLESKSGRWVGWLLDQAVASLEDQKSRADASPKTWRVRHLEAPWESRHCRAVWGQWRVVACRALDRLGATSNEAELELWVAREQIGQESAPTTDRPNTNDTD